MAKKESAPASKEEALELAIAAINKTYGKGSILTGETNVVPDVEFSDSGAVGINEALGGGYPKGRIVEILGPESSGKTTLCLHAVAEAQAAGGKAAFIDMEHAFDPTYARQVGVDMSTLVFAQPNSGEEALNILESLIRTGALSIIVVDSVAALVPQKEIEGEMGDSVMGVHARLMSQAMRKIAGVTHRTNTTVIFVNQIRMKIGVMFGNPECVAPDTRITWRKIKQT